MYATVYPALLATLGTWLVTALGAGTVIFFHQRDKTALNPLLGFAAGVMIAASFWSLLQPAVERATTFGDMPPYAVVTLGFLCGAAFIYLSDQILSRVKARSISRQNIPSNARFRRSAMLFTAITLHNIPEGLAVGVAFGALGEGYTPEGLAAAISISIGVALQNFPEGAAVSLPLRREGCSRLKSFLLGQASGMVEPIAGVLGALLVMKMEAALPFMLAFAAGAMILVSVHELIPESQSEKKNRPYTATVCTVLGFAAMMLLDVALAG